MEPKPLFRRRKHNPHARAVKVHPYDVWGVLYRLQQWEKVKGKTAGFYTIHDIAALLFSNWNELSEHQRQMAAIEKVEPAMLFLRIGHYVREDYEWPKPNPNRPWEEPKPIYKKTYQVKGKGTFHFKSATPEYAKRATWSVMDENWGKWIGRKGLPLKYRYLVDAA